MLPVWMVSWIENDELVWIWHETSWWCLSWSGRNFM